MTITGSKVGHSVMPLPLRSKSVTHLRMLPKVESMDYDLGRTHVYLNVYDLTPVNGYFSWAGLGVFHTGIEVHGVEYGFGAHEYPTTGVFEVEPRKCPGFKFKKSIFMGTTYLDPFQFREFMEYQSPKYNGDTYNLIAKNCNHFCGDICYKLTGNRIPRWINRLARIDIGVMSGAGIFIKDDLRISDVQLEIVMGILNVYSLLGSAAAGRTSDWIGRRYTIVLACVIFFAGALLMGFATNYAFLMVGRFVAGIAVGYAMMIAPVYAAEIAPASSRGFLTSFPEVFINIGILLGYVSNVALSKLPLNLGWRFMLGIGAVPSVVIALGVLAMPESPRWLVLQGRLADAKTVLDKTSDSKEESRLRLDDIKAAAGIPLDCHDDVVAAVPGSTGSHGEGVWKDLLLRPTPAVRHVLLAGVGLHFFQQVSGIDAVVLYSPKIFEKAGIDKSHLLLATVAVGFVKTLSILVATFFVDRAGRRKLLLGSVGGMILCLACLGISLVVIDHFKDEKLTWAVSIAVAAVLLYVMMFSLGLGPVTWIYVSEIFPLRLRAQGTSIGVAVNRVMSGVISMTFLSLSKAMTIGGAFLLFMGTATIGWLYIYLLLPETKGRTLEEMQCLFGGFFRWRSTVRELGKQKSLNGGDDGFGHVELGESKN